MPSIGSCRCEVGKQALQAALSSTAKNPRSQLAQLTSASAPIESAQLYSYRSIVCCWHRRPCLSFAYQYKHGDKEINLIYTASLAHAHANVLPPPWRERCARACVCMSICAFSMGISICAARTRTRPRLVVKLAVVPLGGESSWNDPSNGSTGGISSIDCQSAYIFICGP